MMEIFAGFLEHTDHQIGRLLDFLARFGQLDDTIIMVISDNGASAEGGPHGSVNENLFFNNVPETLQDNLRAIDELGGPKYFNHYPWGWAWAGNTPFRRWKRETYRGGVADPFIVHWPKGIKGKGEIRHQYAHVIDMVPTVLEAIGVEPPHAIRGVTQSPIQGVSFAAAFTDAKAEGAITRSTSRCSAIGPGRHELRFEFEPTGKPDIAHGKGTPARGQLYVDGKLLAEGQLPVTIPLDIGITDGLSCGRDVGSPVSTDYAAPFAFTGALEKVVIDVSGELIEDKAAQMRAVMAHQ
jgi:hypothetical protein